MIELQNRLFSSGLHTLGDSPTEEEIKTYLGAFYGDDLDEDEIEDAEWLTELIVRTERELPAPRPKKKRKKKGSK